jgi:hypothetical protein
MMMLTMQTINVTMLIQSKNQLQSPTLWKASVHMPTPFEHVSMAAEHLMIINLIHRVMNGGTISWGVHFACGRITVAISRNWREIIVVSVSVRQWYPRVKTYCQRTLITQRERDCSHTRSYML